MFKAIQPSINLWDTPEKYNGWGASVANHDGAYGGDEGLYELAEINPNGHIVDESIKGYLTFAEVDCYLREISEY